MWLWEAAWKVFAAHPALGVGPANFCFFYNSYKPASGRYVFFPAVVNNQYLEILAETGIAGMIVFLGFVFSFLKLAGYSIKRRNIEASSIAFSLAAAAIQLNTFSGLTWNYLWVMLGLLAASFKLQKYED